MKDETPRCHRVQAAVKLTQPDVPQQEGWQGLKTEAFDANSEDVVHELVDLLLVNYSSRKHCVVIHAKKQSFCVKSRAIYLSDAVKTTS